ncbi:MAG: hypothetical protein CVV25_07465 [Ignavibacteriae bacterium HGW-Ignavibacteriae-4]|jgi:hypothetical protein|nr:MAG: hypothetical protein CVV25_07465 [Ignavibacteriae bacterium HGW-Ignavibacteriae-4]
MKKIRLILLLAIASLVTVSCSILKTENTEETFLWKVDDGNSHIFLLGSIHVAKQNMYPLDYRIEEAYRGSDIVAFEIDMTKADPMLFMKYMTYTDGTKLKDRISAENYEKLRQKFSSMGMTESMFGNMRPWAAAMSVQTSMLRGAGYDAALGIDQHFMTKATNDSKKVRELETVDYQMDLLSQFDNVGDSFINYTLDNSEEPETEVDRMINAWKTGNKAELQHILDSSRYEYPELEEMYEKIIDERNDNMTKKVEEWLKEDKTIFIVVGAGHIIGERGIINQLKKTDKYKITNF